MQHGAAHPSQDGGGRAVSASGHDPATAGGPTGRPDVRILTSRLRLAEVSEADEAELHALHSDPRAFVEDSTDPLTDRAQMRWLLAQWRESWARHGLGHLTVRAREGAGLPGGLLGVVGLVPLAGATTASPSGTVLSAYWRLHPEATGLGIATEAMRAVLGTLPTGTPHGGSTPRDGTTPEIVAITARGNTASLALALRLGFRPAPPGRPVPGGRADDVLLLLDPSASA